MGLKETYQEKMEAQIREWTAKIKELKARADQATADLKIKMYKEIDELKARQAEAQKKLDQIRGASAEKWESLKASSEQVMEEWKKKWENVKSRYL